MATKMTREEAIKVAYGIPVTKAQHEALQFLIPELRESEDERIRASIADCVGLMGEDGNVFSNHNVTKVQVISWLEKQKDKMTAEEYEKSELFQLKLKTRYANGYQDGLAQKEQKGETLRDFIDDFPYSDEQKEQKPAEWSDTNELVFQDICKHLQEEGYNGWVLLLNALRNGEFQPKQEWDANDKAIVNCIVCFLDGQFVPEVARKQSLEWFNKHRRDFLNSPHWKPSEEHLSALLAVFNDPNNIGSQTCQLALTDLYEQLKKL